MTDIDAELLALEISQELLPPPSLYEQIHKDLIAIRTAYPAMAPIHHQPLWIPGELIGQLTAEAMAQVKTGEYHGLDVVIAEYGPIEIIPSNDASLADLNYVTFKFSRRCNPECLTRPISAADGVFYAHSKWLSGDGNKIKVVDDQYTFSLGWGYCKTVCTYHHYWTISMIDGLASLVDEHGDQLIGDLNITNEGPATVGKSTQLIAKVGAYSHPNVTYVWGFGDGTSIVDGEAKITHIYSAVGEYTVVVTASSFGHIVQETTTIIVTS